jgi:hypothetical protein
MYPFVNLSGLQLSWRSLQCPNQWGFFEYPRDSLFFIVYFASPPPFIVRPIHFPQFSFVIQSTLMPIFNEKIINFIQSIGEIVYVLRKMGENAIFNVQIGNSQLVQIILILL